MVPVCIICYNNGFFVENTIKQLSRLQDTKLIVIDNASSDAETREILAHLASDIEIVQMRENYGHLVFYRPEIYNMLPEHFIITDPDLEFNPEMPESVAQDFIKISEEYQCFKVGLALDISDHDKMYQTTYFNDLTIYQTELRYWSKPIQDPEYKLYAAPIDTTFALYNKKYFVSEERNSDVEYIRVAGKYTARHLPWYPNFIDKLRPKQLLNMYFSNNVSFSAKPIYDAHFAGRIQIVKKRDVKFLVKETKNSNFWSTIYSGWEPETFAVFDQYADKEKNILDIGGWIGTTAIYQSQKYKHVYSVEADPYSVIEFYENVKLNEIKNITLIDRAVSNTNDGVIFGPNPQYGLEWNNSASQVYSPGIKTKEAEIRKGKGVQIASYTFNTLIERYNIANLALIKCDIEGSEEAIMSEMLTYCLEKNVPCYLSFHYDWWSDRKIERFDDLFAKFVDGASVSERVKREPFVSVLMIPLVV